MNEKTKIQSAATWRQNDRVCVKCGYGIASGKLAVRCPICGSTGWIQSPLRRAA